MVDDTAKKILMELQTDSWRSNKTIAATLGLSEPVFSKKIKDLKDDGVIKKFTIEVDYDKAGFPIGALTLIRLKDHAAEEPDTLLEGLKEAVQVYRLTGSWDYAVIWACSNPRELGVALQHVRTQANIEHLETSVFLQRVKNGSAAPF